MQKPFRTLISVAVLATMTGGIANAAGFSLYSESSPAAMGNFAAGIAAEAADASTGWFNPAGLALIHDEQAVFGGIGIFPSSKLTGFSTFSTVGLPSYTQRFDGLNGAKNALVPSFHVARPLGENAAVGFSMVSPFGLSTEWSRTSPVRYAATFTELLTTTFSPEIGGKIFDNFAVGAGLDLQYARVKFNRVLGAPPLMQAFLLPGNFVDSLSYNRGDSFGVGFHAGLMGMFDENHTRIGLNYQSRVNHKFHGYSRLQGRFASPGLTIASPVSVATANPNALFWSNNLSSNNIEFPEIITLSGYRDVNDTFAVLGSVVYSGWHVLRTVQLNNVAAFAPGLGRVKVNSAAAENYRNSWRAALGVNYRYSDQIMLRAGGGYDETPTVDSVRDIRLPDVDRWGASIGGHYQWRPNIGFDVGYTHLFGARRTPINKTDITGTTSAYNVNATGKAYADLVGVQLVWNIDGVPVAPTK